MNTKKIWIISLILGIMVAVFAYVAILSKGNASPTSGSAVGQDKDTNKEKQTDLKTKADKKSEAEKEQKLKREFTNPIVDVSKGKRAISLKINLEQGVSGYVAPNSRVDVMAYENTKDDKTGKEYKSAVLILENVKVLTSGKSSDNKDATLQYETVTVEVTPEEGVMLGLASKDKDGFYLMLRNNDDTATGKAGLKQTREVLKEEGQGTK